MNMASEKIKAKHALRKQPFDQKKRCLDEMNSGNKFRAGAVQLVPTREVLSMSEAKGVQCKMQLL